MSTNGRFLYIWMFMLGCAFVCALCARADAPSTGVVFKDSTADLGLTPPSESCWIDIDNDGWVDLIAGGVWKNNAGKSFTKIAELAHCVAGDFDNDGFADLFSWSGLKLYHNDGGKGFTEFKLPELPKTVCTCACWGDFSGDGFIDLYVCGYEDWDAGITYPSFILISNRGREFVVASTLDRYRTRGVTACDFDQDGDIDIYVSNYRLQPNNLWLNNREGGIADVAPEYNAVATSPGFPGGHSIGAAWGDFDNDGLFDLFVGNFAHVDGRGDQPKSRFLRNLGPAQSYHFDDKGTCGVFYQESYASPAAGDYDNDGNLDLFFTTVYGTASFGKANNPVLYHNEGGFVFIDATSSAGVAQLPPTYQAAWADFNNDGCLDLATAGKLFVNQGGGGHWLKVRLTGDGRTVNQSAIGAQVRVKLKDKTLTRQVEAGTGAGNQNDLTLHFGLGEQSKRVTMEVFWPNGDIQTIRRVKTDRLKSVRFKPSPGVFPWNF